MAEEKKVYVPEDKDWQRGKAIARCACTDADRMECLNFEAVSTMINGNEACGCPCHKTRPTEA